MHSYPFKGWLTAGDFAKQQVAEWNHITLSALFTCHFPSDLSHLILSYVGNDTIATVFHVQDSDLSSQERSFMMTHNMTMEEVPNCLRKESKSGDLIVLTSSHGFTRNPWGVDVYFISFDVPNLLLNQQLNNSGTSPFAIHVPREITGHVSFPVHAYHTINAQLNNILVKRSELHLFSVALECHHYTFKKFLHPIHLLSTSRLKICLPNGNLGISLAPKKNEIESEEEETGAHGETELALYLETEERFHTFSFLKNEPTMLPRIARWVSLQARTQCEVVVSLCRDERNKSLWRDLVRFLLPPSWSVRKRSLGRTESHHTVLCTLRGPYQNCEQVRNLVGIGLKMGSLKLMSRIVVFGLDSEFRWSNVFPSASVVGRCACGEEYIVEREGMGMDCDSDDGGLEFPRGWSSSREDSSDDCHVFVGPHETRCEFVNVLECLRSSCFLVANMDWVCEAPFAAQ